MSENDIAVLRLALCRAQGYLQELVSQEDRPGARSVLQEINAALEVTRACAEQHGLPPRSRADLVKNVRQQSEGKS